MTLQRLPEGTEGIKQTLRVMRGLVRRWKKDPELRRLALSLVKRNGQKDFRGEVANLHAYVRDRIRYVKDINGVETLHTPPRILEQGQGDCDDKSVLLATLLETIGHPTRFVAVGFDPWRLSHVYVETLIGDKNNPGQWLPLETTEPVEPGWSPPRVVRRLVMHNR